MHHHNVHHVDQTCLYLWMHTVHEGHRAAQCVVTNKTFKKTSLRLSVVYFTFTFKDLKERDKNIKIDNCMKC